MLLLVAGALISSLVFPYITRQWQENEKEFELKTELVEEINKAITNTLTAQQNNFRPTLPMAASAAAAAPMLDQNLSRQFEAQDLLTQLAINQGQKFLDSQIDWQISKEVIGSKIDLYYFSHDEISKNWDKLSSAISGMWTIASVVIPPQLRFEMRLSENTPSNYEVYQYQMCDRLGNILNIHEIYPDDPININPQINTYFDCNRFYVPGLEKLEQIKFNYNATDRNIDWNALFLSSFESRIINQTFEDQKKFTVNYFKLHKKIMDHKDDILVAVSNSHITAFE